MIIRFLTIWLPLILFAVSAAISMFGLGATDVSVVHDWYPPEAEG